MGGADDCTIFHSISASSGLPHALDVRPSTFSKGSISDQTGSSTGSKKVVCPDIGLAGTDRTMEANCCNFQQKIKGNPSDYKCGADGKCLKKPDKALPCPRCDSVDTKFCYYNNYNVNQPRHFCKGCQRYWTAGGTLRNVAVGAGRRKRKHSSFGSESGTEASSIECHAPQECSATRSSLNDCKFPSSVKDASDNGFRPGGVYQKKLQLPLVESSPFVSDILLSEKMQGKFSSEPPRAERNSTSHYKSGPTCSSGDIRNQAKSFHEFMQLKSTAALSTKHKNSCNSLQHFHVSSSDSNFLNTLNDELKDEGGKLALALPSERQASNESGCASSLTTQALSEDACTNGGRSDIFSEISKGGGNCDKGGNLNCEKPSLPYHLFCKVPGKVPAINRSFQRDCTSLATGLSTVPFLKGPLETDDFGAAGTMLPMPPFWALSGKRPGLLWGAPLCPTARAVNAAKASLMLNAGALQKSQSPPLIGMVLSSKMLAQNEPRMESTNPEMHI